MKELNPSLKRGIQKFLQKNLHRTRKVCNFVTLTDLFKSSKQLRLKQFLPTKNGILRTQRPFRNIGIY